MAANKLIFKDAEKARDAILESQKKEIAQLYEKWADEIGEKAQKFSYQSTASSIIQEQQMKELQKMLNESSHQVSNEVYNKVKQNIYYTASEVTQSNINWMKSLGFAEDALSVAFNSVPDATVRNLVTGQIYDSGWSLSKRIWSDNEDTLKSIYEVVAGGIAQNKGIYDIAKDLEKYVRPSAVKPWNLKAADGKKIYPKQIDYNAQRLARTLVQHGYQQSFVATTQSNPFITDYIWDANGSRVCDLCMERDGRHYKKTDLPLDHPNGMCTMVPNVVNNLTDQLADWHNAPDGTYPEIDAFAKNFGYDAKSMQAVSQKIEQKGAKHLTKKQLTNSLPDYWNEPGYDPLADGKTLRDWYYANEDNTLIRYKFDELNGSKDITGEYQYYLNYSKAEWLEIELKAFTNGAVSARSSPDFLLTQIVEDAIKESNSLWSGGELYRGVVLEPDEIAKLKVGAKVDQKGFSSWSSNKSVADEFASLGGDIFSRLEDMSSQAKPVIFVDKTEGTRNAISIQSYAPKKYKYQEEVLYSGNSKFEIIDIANVDDVLYAYVKEVLL